MNGSAFSRVFRNSSSDPQTKSHFHRARSLVGAEEYFMKDEKFAEWERITIRVAGLVLLIITVAKVIAAEVGLLFR
jgi:hypothetical protein